MTLHKKLITNFNTHLRTLGYSKNSIKMLPSCVRDFLQHQPHEKPQKITTQNIKNYHQYLQERPNKRRPGGLSESYINHHIYALKLFFHWLIEKQEITENPISSLEFKAPTSKPREVLTTYEVKKLYKACENYKETAVLSIFYGCGLRRTEGEKLDLKDIHFRTGILYVREGKGKKRRAIPMSKKVNQDLKNYAQKERFAKQEEKAFICNRINKRTSGNSYNNILKILLEKAGITKEITLHCLRHSIATHLLENGLSVEYVRDFLGHKHLESTQIYTRVSLSKVSNITVEP